MSAFQFKMLHNGIPPSIRTVAHRNHQKPRGSAKTFKETFPRSGAIFLRMFIKNNETFFGFLAINSLNWS
ncbi:hypothetical protein GCK32_014752 [Trichostrongylus colubriformis]|uniref:Uncharacterized protein n=1 Tax=Trichostrongylus colubriformis TaxID=6319 RepID=A0AAN8F912_TRICO